MLEPISAPIQVSVAAFVPFSLASPFAIVPVSPSIAAKAFAIRAEQVVPQCSRPEPVSTAAIPSNSLDSATGIVNHI